MDDIEYSERGCIIVVEIQTDSSHVLVGIMVDSVSEVTAIRQADIEDPPSFGISVDTSFLSGMAKIGNGVKSLLDIDRVMSSGEIMNLPQSIEL